MSHMLAHLNPSGRCHPGPAQPDAYVVSLLDTITCMEHKAVPFGARSVGKNKQKL